MGYITYTIKNFDKIALGIGSLVCLILGSILFVEVAGLIGSSFLPSTPCHVTRIKCLGIPDDRYVCQIKYIVGNSTFEDLTNVKHSKPMEENTTCYILDNKYVLDNWINIYGWIESIKGTLGTLLIIGIMTILIGLIPFLIKRYISQTLSGGVTIL